MPMRENDPNVGLWPIEAHRCMEENRAGGKIVVLTGGKDS